MSAATPLTDERFSPQTTIILTDPPKEISDLDNNMPHPRRQPGPFTDDEMREMVRDLLCTMHRREHANEQIEKAQRKWWVSPIAAVGAVFVAVFGISYIPASQGRTNEEVRMIQYRLDQSEKREGELRDRMQSQEYIWTNLQKQLAVLGLQIDSKTGEIILTRTRVR